MIIWKMSYKQISKFKTVFFIKVRGLVTSPHFPVVLKYSNNII